MAGAGAGNDSYLLASGLQIASAQVAATALKLNLTSGATISGFSTANDRLLIDLPSANSAITTLAQLNGQQGVIVQTDPFTGSTLINFGVDANGAQPVTLTLTGVSDPAAVLIQVV